MPGRPDSGELAQAGIDALAVERLCMRPEGTAELDARCDFDALRRDGQRLELVADRMFRVLVGEAERTRSEEHTSELQSLMRISYAVFCLKKKTNNNQSLTPQL